MHSLKRARIANSMMFLVCGLGVSSWAPLVPMAKQRLHLDNGNLGILLLSFGIGAMATMPLTGSLVAKFGSKKVIVLSGTLISIALPLLLLINNALLLGLCLFFFGTATGGINVAMNSQALRVQQAYGKHIMSSFHGLYSVGGLLGSLGFGLMIKAGADAMTSICCISVLLLLITYSQYSYLMPDDDTQTTEKTRFVLPTGVVLILGIICFVSALAEGAMLDWSAVFLTINRHIDIAYAGAGYATFSIAMALMRLTGDYIIGIAGKTKVVVFGSIIASCGLLLAVCFSSIPLALAGFLLVGIGCSNIIPILFSASGDLPGISPLYALPAVTSMAYAGILAGPALIGLVAQISSLPISLGIVGVFILLAGIIYKLRFGNPQVNVH